MSETELQLQIRLTELQIQLETLKNASPESQQKLFMLELAKAGVSKTAGKDNLEPRVDELVRKSGYDLDEEYFENDWISVAETVGFGFATTADEVRRWCEGGLVVCRNKPGAKRKIWEVCPKSAAIKVGNEIDPRLQADNYLPCGT